MVRVREYPLDPLPLIFAPAYTTVVGIVIFTWPVFR
jgi:hypothetical protein